MSPFTVAVLVTIIPVLIMGIVAYKLFNKLPAKLVFGKGTDEERVYDTLVPSKKACDDDNRYRVVEWVKKHNACLGKNHLEYLLNHQDEIPDRLREKVIFVFVDCDDPDCPDNVEYVYWFHEKWNKSKWYFALGMIGFYWCSRDWMVLCPRD